MSSPRKKIGGLIALVLVATSVIVATPVFAAPDWVSSYNSGWSLAGSEFENYSDIANNDYGSVVQTTYQYIPSLGLQVLDLGQTRTVSGFRQSYRANTTGDIIITLYGCSDAPCSSPVQLATNTVSIANTGSTLFELTWSPVAYRYVGMVADMDTASWFYYGNLFLLLEPLPTPTATNTPTNTPLPTATPTPTATNTPTNTPLPTATNTPAPTATPAPGSTPDFFFPVSTVDTVFDYAEIIFNGLWDFWALVLGSILAVALINWIAKGIDKWRGGNR